MKKNPNSPDSDDASEERSLLDELLTESRLYQGSREFKEFLDFAVRLRNVAPFNAMLLQIQKPGLTYAASAYEWDKRFNRTVKEYSRPLFIMWPFGPVALVYDIQDTEGDDLPKDAFSFYAKGSIDDQRIVDLKEILQRKEIRMEEFDRGDGDAGEILRMTIASDDKTHSKYRITINRNHSAAMQFATLVHELAHLYLGHLGDDPKLGIKKRVRKHRIKEIEAESVAYIVSHRNGVECRSESYLNGFIEQEKTSADIDHYAITTAAGHIERLLGLSRSMKWRN